MDKNRIEGAVEQGERAINREALVTKATWRKSGGFRPGRRAHDAVLAAQSYVQSGRRVVVDVDLEKFFDRVNHDILIDRLRKRIADAGVIRWCVRI